jgi:hypothetical protein
LKKYALKILREKFGAAIPLQHQGFIEINTRQNWFREILEIDGTRTTTYSYKI